MVHGFRVLVKGQNIYISLVQFSRSVVSDSLQPNGLQHARPPCPSPTPGVHSNSRPYVSVKSEVDKKGIHRKLVSPLLPFKKAALNALFCAFLLMNGVSIISSSSQLVSVEIGCYLEL